MIGDESMERGREIKYPNGFSHFDIDKQVAEIMGLKTDDGFYRSLDPAQGTLFTNASHFSVDDRLIPYMIKFAKNKGIVLENTKNPLAASKELIAKLG